MAGNRAANPGKVNTRIKEKILLIDDDLNLLQGVQRHLRKLFKIETARNGDQGLLIVKTRGPIAVAVSDLNMPGMDGVQFLSKISQVSPETVRIILTGGANPKMVADAVNTGNVFKFLTKPCNAKELARAMMEGVEQYRKVQQAKNAARDALNATINVLIEILGMVQPRALGRASRVKRYVRQAAIHLKPEHLWHFEHAAMLSQLGWITLPGKILEKLEQNEDLEPGEQKLFEAHPLVSYKMLKSIPGFELVARMVRDQNTLYSAVNPHAAKSEEDRISAMGANLLKLCLDFDALVQAGETAQAALLTMEEAEGTYNAELLRDLKEMVMRESDVLIKKVNVFDLGTDMIFDQDVYAKNGNLLASKGQGVTFPIIELMKNYLSGIGIEEPFRVMVPAQA